MVNAICVPLGEQIPEHANYRVIANRWIHKLQRMTDEGSDPVHGNSKLKLCQEYLPADWKEKSESENERMAKD
jgi:hypothetical protein